MPRTFYVIAPVGKEVADPTTQAERAATLGCQPVNGYDNPNVTVWPSVLLVPDVPNATPTVIPDDSGQATLAEVQAAQQAATTAEQSYLTAKTDSATTIKDLLGQQSALTKQIEADLASVATWDTLTASERAAIMGRVVAGFTTTMQAIVAHLTLTGHAS